MLLVEMFCFDTVIRVAACAFVNKKSATCPRLPEVGAGYTFLRVAT